MPPKTRKKSSRPNPAVVADIVGRIVRAAQPEKIIMFGSAARGAMGPNSDYDFLVIKRGKFNNGRVLDAIITQLSGKAAAVDVVLVTPEDVERYRKAFSLVICSALENGQVVYESQALSAGRSPRVAQSSARQPGSGPDARRRRVS